MVNTFIKFKFHFSVFDDSFFMLNDTKRYWFFNIKLHFAVSIGISREDSLALIYARSRSGTRTGDRISLNVGIGHPL